MKKLLALLLAAAMMLSVAACAAPGNETPEIETAPAPTEQTAPAETEPVNLIENGTFDTGCSPWGLYTESGGEAELRVENGALIVDIGNTGTVAHAVQVYYDGCSLLKGGKYIVSFDISSTEKRSVRWRIQLNSGDYRAYAGSEGVKVDSDTKHVSMGFIMKDASDPAPRLCFNLGNVKGLGKHALTIDNVQLLLVDDSGVEKTEVIESARDININQVGYRPGDSKTAVFRDVSAGSEYQVINADTGAVVYTGTTADAPCGGSSGDDVSWGDFTDLRTPGSYYLSLPDGSRESYRFTVSETVYDELLRQTLRFLYLQRCGTEVAGEFGHDACHTELATVYGTEETAEVSGGWHDAGDYGRYTVPGAKTAADLMLAYEMNPGVFDDNLGIPESGNGVPDVLDEARYELEWLLKMQRADGGVYHKVTGMNFDGTVMADKCTAKLYLWPVSTTATGDFAGVMYMAARVFENIDTAFAETCYAAADRALDYTEVHLEDEGFRNPADCATGEYPDNNAMDEYLWALCEGYKTSQDATLLPKIRAFVPAKLTGNGLGWIEMDGYAFWAAMTCGDDTVAGYVSPLLTEWVWQVQDNIAVDSYRSSIPDDYPWGSNMTIANNGCLLLMAKALGMGTTDPQTQLDCLLGVNPISYCYVSGFGQLSPEHPHHRPSQSKGSAMPGMLAGGPNNGLEDPYAARVLQGKANPACYVDNDQSYSTNEVAIYWNSPLVWLISGIMTPTAPAEAE